MSYVLLMFRSGRDFDEGNAVIGPFRTPVEALKHTTPLPDGGVWVLSVLNEPPAKVKPKAKKKAKRKT